MTDPSHATSPRSDLDDEALDWFVRSSGTPPGAGADEALQRWLAGDRARADALARWQADWHQLDGLPAAGVRQLRRQLQADKAADSAGKVGRSWWPGLRALAPQAGLAAALVALTGGGYVAWNHWQQQPLYVQSFETQRGQQLNVQLPDGSQLRLDTATRVDVRLYRQRREVHLPEGQVVFAVQGDGARPFEVLAGQTRVTVVGTRFSVRHVAGTPVGVAVEEGRVRVGSVADPGQAPAVLLGAGQQLVGGLAGTLGAVAASGIAPWRDGRITLDNVPLSQALAEFERYGPTRMSVHDPAVAALRVSGTFDPRHLENFRRSLPLVLPVRLQENGARVEIVARP